MESDIRHVLCLTIRSSGSTTEIRTFRIPGHGSNPYLWRMLMRSIPYVLLIHNLWYFWGKFTLPKQGQVSEIWYAAIATRPYEIYNAHFLLFAFFEFIAVAALFSDLIIRWDEFGPRRNWKFMASAAFLLLFIVKCGIRLMEAYMLQS